jgi:hypothetical protein
MPAENQATHAMKTKLTNTEKQPKAGHRRALGLATGSRLVLQQRWYDTARGCWDEWHDVEKHKLRSHFGESPANWKVSCTEWVKMGGLYHFRIVERTDRLTWQLQTSANVAVTNFGANKTP